MDNNLQSNPLPEKVVRRHFELLKELLPDFRDRVIDEGRPADQLLYGLLRNHRELGSRDRRFLSQAVFAYFRWLGWSAGRLGLEPVEACLLGALLDMTEAGPSFEYIRAQCNLPEGLAPIGDRSLAEKCQCVQEWFSTTLAEKPLALTDLLPAAFEDTVDPAMIGPCVEAFQQRPPAWFRSRTAPAELLQAMEAAGIPGKAHPRVEQALSIEGGINLAHKLGNHAGQFVVQDIASQCVGLVCAPAPTDEWWDCCAGAGGKSLHLMDLMGQDGKVLATDVRIEALKELKKRARHYGIRQIRTQPFNASSDEPFRKTFDGVLVDAPCSGWGTWSRNPDARWRSSAREVIQCASRQLKILNNATWCVRPGGVLVYAVCTLTRPETEEVVMNFLDQQPGFSPEPFINPLTGEPTNGPLQIWPWDAPGDAMFIARFRRTGN